MFSRGVGGYGLYISNRIEHRVVFKSSVNDKCESLFVELYSGDVKVIFGLVYMPPPGDFPVFEEVHNELFLRYLNVIVVDDFNCNIFDPRKSVRALPACFRLNLSVLHNSKPPHTVIFCMALLL